MACMQLLNKKMNEKKNEKNNEEFKDLENDQIHKNENK